MEHSRHVTRLSTALILVALAYLPATRVMGAAKIAAFNVQILGRTKMSKPDVVGNLIEILRRYDIVLVQEIRDVSLQTIPALLDKINEDSGSNYNCIESARLGRTSQKEQYAFFYRQDDISVSDTYQYPDVGDIFEREPYSVLFTSANTAIGSFVLTAIHVRPSDAQSEINALDEVREDVFNHWNNPNILIMGSLDADCRYLSNSKYEALDMLNDQQYHWLVPDDWDTSLASSSCAYDRFVMTGDAFINAVQPCSVQVYDFETDLGLSHDDAKAVSDHFPIELTLVEKYGYM